MPLSRVLPEDYENLLADKVERVLQGLAEFSPPAPTIQPSAPTGFRLRAEFRMMCADEKMHYVMFRRDEPKIPIVIHNFLIADAHIQQLMPMLLELLNQTPSLRHKLFQVEFLSTLVGEMLVTLVYHCHLDAAWKGAAEHLQATLQHRSFATSIIGRSRKQKIVLGKDYVREVFRIHGREYRFRQYEQSFSQPNGLVNTRMVEWACEQAAGARGDLLELFCGNGNFTLPLSRYFNNVIATETAKVSVRSATENIADNEIENVFIARLSAEEVAQAMQSVRIFRRLSALPKPLHEFDLQTLFVDPPRAGLDDHTVAMASQFPTIIYMSCNPATLVQNLRSLNKTHRIDQFALFDQFPYTDHIECGVLLRRH